VITLGRIVAGDQVTLMVRDLEVSRPVQAFDVLAIVAVALPLVTLGTFDPDTVHPFDVKVIAVDPALVPLVVSGGENATCPVMLVQVTLPAATVTVAEVGLELHPVANTATRPSGRRNTNLDVRLMDMTVPLVI
jgi:hypothetical protein